MATVLLSREGSSLSQPRQAPAQECRENLNTDTEYPDAVWLGPSHSTSLGGTSSLLLPELVRGVLSAGVWLGSARSFLMTGKTQVRQKWTLAIPGEQAGRHLPISSFLVSGSPLVPSGPSRERGVCGLSHSLCPQGLLGGIKEVV